MFLNPTNINMHVFFKRDMLQIQKKTLPGNRWTPSSELVFTKNQQIRVLIIKLSIYPTHIDATDHIPTGTTQTPVLIDLFFNLSEMGGNQLISDNFCIFALLSLTVAAVCGMLGSVRSAQPHVSSGGPRHRLCR